MSDTTETTATTDGAGITPGAGSGSGTPAATTPAERTFTQTELNALIAEEKRKLKAQQESAAQAAAAKAAEEAAAKSGEWQQLAEQRAAERDRLQAEAATLTERHAALAQQVEAMLKAQLKELPEAIRDLDPGGDDLAARLAWVAKARKAASAVPATPGTPPGPRGTGAGAAPIGTTDADLMAQKRRQIGAL